MNLLKKEIPSLTKDPANKAQPHVSSMMSAFIFIFRKVGSHFYCSNLLVNSQRRHTLFDMMRRTNQRIVSLESERVRYLRICMMMLTKSQRKNCWQEEDALNLFVFLWCSSSSLAPSHSVLFMMCRQEQDLTISWRGLSDRRVISPVLH